jgi:hypothetical protein
MQANITLAENLPAATVEFWFKLPASNTAVNSTSYLFSMYSMLGQIDQWVIKMDNANGN